MLVLLLARSAPPVSKMMDATQPTSSRDVRQPTSEHPQLRVETCTPSWLWRACPTSWHAVTAAGIVQDLLETLTPIQRCVS